MAQLMHIIDKRSAKFTSRDSFKSIVSLKDSRNVKLTPLDIQPPNKIKEDVPVTKKIRRIKVQASDILKLENFEEIETSPVGILNNSKIHDFSNHLDSNEISEGDTKLQNEDFQNISSYSYSQISINQSKSLLTDSEVQIFWFKLFKTLSFKPFSARYNWMLYKVWRCKLKRGINLLAKKRTNLIKSCIKIQSTFKMFKSFKAFKALKNSSNTIKSFWKNTWKNRKFFLALKTISLLLCPIFKLKYHKKQQAAVRIQKVFRGFKVFKQYRPLLEKQLEIRKHNQLLERQRSLKKAKNQKKIAVRIIEQEWMSYKTRKNLKDIRKYLWSLPFECRILYFKFQQVKKDADNLKNDVDLLIAKKQGKIQTNL